jgi:hypothetical protein
VGCNFDDGTQVLMPHADLGVVSQRLFEDFLAPLVLGGEVRPGRPIGSRGALELGAGRVIADGDLLSRVQLGRTRIARRLAPVDPLEEGPTPCEWALGATLHDVVQAAHPGLDTPLRRIVPVRLLKLAEATLARIPPPRSVGEALARHSWFARLFEMERTDTTVSWWVGSRAFLGETPPARLATWPDLRRVRIEKLAHTITELPGAGGAVDLGDFAGSLKRFLAKTPLTDLATCHRDAPVFAWGHETLGLVATDAGRTLATRAFAHAPKGAVDASLGRATRALVEARAWRAAGIACDVLAERALAEAETSLGDAEPPFSLKKANDDAGYAQYIGARVACESLRAGMGGFSDAARLELLARLVPATTSEAARTHEAEISRYFLATAVNAAGAVGGSSVSIEP